MGFLTIQFLIFIIVALVLYSLVARRRNLANSILIVANFTFYGWWNPWFMILLLATTFNDFVAALIIERAPRYRRIAVGLSLTLNLGTLFTFKYFNFFAGDFQIMMTSFGLPVHQVILDIGLPIGLSFFTFQGISYVVDVYRGILKAEDNPITYLAYASFFPQLAAGPIERGAHLLPQFRHFRPLSLCDGERAIRLIIWGYFMKVVVADSLAPVVDLAFSPTHHWGWWTIIGTISFTIQIYADFAGYSWIAKGLGLLFGINLMRNFNNPYWSTSISEFWRRWHISLSSWLRDYLYVTMGGNRKGQSRVYVNLMATMLLGGLWHGANWTFVVWGGWHGLLLVIDRLWTRTIGQRIPLPRWVGWLLTFSAVAVGLFVFRAPSLAMAGTMIANFSDMTWLPAHSAALKMLIALSLPIVVTEWAEQAGFRIDNKPILRGAILGLLAVTAIAASNQVRPSFIYFQF